VGRLPRDGVLGEIPGGAKSSNNIAYSNMVTFEGEIITAIPNNVQAVQHPIYPNPSYGMFTVEGTGTMNIYDASGKLYSSNKINGIESYALPSGVYMVCIEHQPTQRLIIL